MMPAVRLSPRRIAALTVHLSFRLVRSFVVMPSCYLATFAAEAGPDLFRGEMAFRAILAIRSRPVLPRGVHYGFVIDCLRH